MKTLPFYKDYFKIAYPLPKMDLIAIQVDTKETYICIYICTQSIYTCMPYHAYVPQSASEQTHFLYVGLCCRSHGELGIGYIQVRT